MAPNKGWAGMLYITFSESGMAHYLVGVAYLQKKGLQKSPGVHQKMHQS